MERTVFRSSDLDKSKPWAMLRATTFDVEAENMTAAVNLWHRVKESVPSHEDRLIAAILGHPGYLAMEAFVCNLMAVRCGFDIYHPSFGRTDSVGCRPTDDGNGLRMEPIPVARTQIEEIVSELRQSGYAVTLNTDWLEVKPKEL